MNGSLVGARVRRVFLFAGLVFAAWPAGSALATTASFTTQGCGNTVSANLFTVPAGVTSVQITATGSAGQTVTRGGAPGGTGDVVSGTLSGLSSGQVLDVCVNAGGGPAGSGEVAGNFGGTGGGASGVALGSDFSAPVLIAAGGGGGGSGGAAVSGNSGGGAGLPSGGMGSPAPPCTNSLGGGPGACGGGGGTQLTFGAGGSNDPGCGPNGPTCTASGNGAASSSAGPGAGGAGSSSSQGGGGGGAGYFGGGGGGGSLELDGGGGGGGSDLCASSVTGCNATGTNSAFGSASVVLTYTPAGALAQQLVLASTGVAPGAALADKASAIQTAVNANPAQIATACADITNYLGLVKAQTGKKLTTSAAATLTTDADNLAGALGCT